MTGLGIIFIAIGYVAIYTGFVGDGTTHEDGSRSFSLAQAFKNAVNGSFVRPNQLSEGGVSTTPSGQVKSPVINTIPGAGGELQIPKGGRFSYAQLIQLWTRNGGSVVLAPVMAAIALAESGGNPNAHNGNAATGDDSYGLWQMNYYGSLRPGRVARYGPPESQYNPNHAAQSAIDLAQGGRGLGNWSTYLNGAYRRYLKGG